MAKIKIETSGKTLKECLKKIKKVVKELGQSLTQGE